MIALLTTFAVILSTAAALPQKGVCHEPTSTTTTTTPPPSPPSPTPSLGTTTQGPITYNCSRTGPVNCELSGAGLELYTFPTGVYHISDIATTWCEASDFCTANNMQLAHTYTLETLRSLMKAAEKTKSVFHRWLGATDLGYLNGDMKWTNGLSVEPELWWSTADDKKPNCGVFCRVIEGVYLHHFECKEKSDGFVCEIPPYCSPAKK